MTGSANIHCIDCIPHGNQFFFTHVSKQVEYKEFLIHCSLGSTLKVFLILSRSMRDSTRDIVGQCC